MNFSQMNYFRAVAEEEHISRAAEKLHISQPSLSATIHRMELELNTPLFDRKGRNIYLNDAGRNLLDHVNYIFSKMNYLEKELRNKEFELSNTVSLAVNNSMFLDNWFSDILISNKIVRISQRVMSEVQMLEALETESVDIALGDFSNVPSGIVSYMLVPDEYIIVVPTSHPLASHEVLYFEDIRNEPFVALSSSTSARIMDRLFAQKMLRLT